MVEFGGGRRKVIGVECGAVTEADKGSTLGGTVERRGGGELTGVGGVDDEDNKSFGCSKMDPDYYGSRLRVWYCPVPVNWAVVFAYAAAAGHLL